MIAPGSTDTGRRLRALILVLVVAKLLITAWNAYAYAQRPYDRGHHVLRAGSGGLLIDRTAYNGPFYYLPALPARAVAEAMALAPRVVDRVSLGALRWTNLVYLTLLYASWIYGIFPRVLPGAQAWAAASLVLLALPGFQKLAVMPHPDNMLASLTGVCLWLWLRLRERLRETRRSRSPLPLLAALAALCALLGLSRPFAVVPLLVVWALTLRELACAYGWASRRFLAQAAVVSLVMGLPSLAWQAARSLRSGSVTDVYPHGYLDEYRPHADAVRFLPYFTTFHLHSLLQRPNRTMTDLVESPTPYQNPLGNSFWTLAYSEIWADHWLYFSGGHRAEGKLGAKRVLLVAALPFSLLLAGRLLSGILALLRRAWRRAPGIAPPLGLAVLVLLGFALYLYWQTGDGLTAGKNSSIKFIYVAHLFAPAITLAFYGEPAPWSLRVLTPYALLIFALALPIAIWLPL